MAMNIERLLRMTADYHKFLNDDRTASADMGEDELSVDELTFVAAAAAVEKFPEEKEKNPLF